MRPFGSDTMSQASSRKTSSRQASLRTTSSRPASRKARSATGSTAARESPRLGGALAEVTDNGSVEDRIYKAFSKV